MGLEWIPLLEKSGLSGIAIAIIVVLIIFSNIVVALLSRGSSRDKIQSQLVEQTIKRQNELDIRQEKMMNDLQEELDRVRDEMVRMQVERKADKDSYSVLQSKYAELITAKLELEQKLMGLKTERTTSEGVIRGLQDKNEAITLQSHLPLDRRGSQGI